MTTNSNAWIAGPIVADFPNQSTKVVTHGSESIVIIHWDGAFTAFRNECLHQEMPLHAGSLLDGQLLCPWHNWCYDVRTGECATVRGAALQQYPVRVDDGQVWIETKTA